MRYTCGVLFVITIIIGCYWFCGEILAHHDIILPGLGFLTYYRASLLPFLIAVGACWQYQRETIMGNPRVLFWLALTGILDFIFVIVELSTHVSDIGVSYTSWLLACIVVVLFAVYSLGIYQRGRRDTLTQNS